MVVGGESVGFIGDTVSFETTQKAAEFEKRLGDGIAQHKPVTGENWGVRVIAYFLHEKELQRFATERASQRYPGVAVAFLSSGAVHACKEFGITYQPSNGPNTVLPEWAVPTIDETYRSRHAFAGADPH